ncbi:MAG: type II secretion system F family protein [Candidatus Eremiobacteraeota bacterium]|nr:type II secretion system F family protein [Candidatus Eremiobacteraeota bacterium]MCW5869532.1 type II secretion system F family protein [Candidatus Eremiobacteraeota bacterium]
MTFKRFLSQRVTAQHRAVFFRCLATLFESGVPLLLSTQLLARQTESAPLAAAAEDLSQQLARGNSLSKSMTRHPWCFTPMQIALVRVGENSGRLGGVFSRLASEEEHRSALLQKMRASLMLPIFISLACVALIALIAPLVLGSVIQQMGLTPAQMPWPTRILIFMAALLRSPVCWSGLLALVAGAAFGLARLEKTPGGRRWRAGVLDAIPGLGRVLRLYAVAQFTQTLETTLEVGFPLIKSLEMSASASAHPLLQEAIPVTLEAVEAGVELDKALARCEFFPTLLIQGAKAGIEAGGLTHMLRHLARMYQQDVDYASETLGHALEPLVIAVVGLMVGFAVVATLLPMTRLVESL